jgi:hypothetical protein
MTRPLLILACALGLAACGGTGPLVTDGSGNHVQIGGDTASAGGPGSPGWPEPTGSQRAH